MSILINEFDQPLGQGKPARRAVRRGLSLSLQGVISGLAVTGLVAASAAIALRERPWHAPAPPEAAASAAPSPSATASALKPVTVPAGKAATSGPQIIRVNPAEDAGGKGVIVLRDPAALGQDLRTAHLPDRALVEESPDGLLPVRSADGRRPFDAYRRPWSGTRGARVAIVIGGLGLSQTGTQKAIDKLPPEVTLAFATAGNSLSRWMQTARHSGRELWLQLPLEPFDYPRNDPGRNTLTTDAAPDENASRLHWALGRTTNYVGVMNYMGARFTAEEQAMRPVMEELGRRGLAYLDDGSSARSTAPNLAPADRVPFAAGDATIDAAPDRAAILKKLDQLEQMARARGSAVGVGSAFDTTIDTVAQWVAEARKRGIEIVPVSAVAADPEK